MSTSEKNVLAIIVNFNGGELVHTCVRSLFDQSYRAIQVVVVDNASTDGSVESLESAFPGLKVVRMGFNAGWGVACNAGIRFAQSDYVALINNDAYLHNDCIAEMVQTLEVRPQCGSVASRILLSDRPGILEVCGLLIAEDGSSCGRGRLEPDNLYLKSEEVFCANDCCCLYRRAMLDDIGDYDPDFFIYCDETDMGFRHQLAGWTCLYEPRALAWHAHSRGAGSYSDFKAYYVERNRLLLVLKYFPWDLALRAFLLSLVRYLQQVWASRRSGRGALARYCEERSLWSGLMVLVRAHLDALRLAPRMLKRRREMAGIRRLDKAGFQSLFRRFGVSLGSIAVYE